MISKIYKSAYKTLFEKRKGMKRLRKKQAYKEAAAMSSLSPSIKRVVTYKNEEEEIK